MSRIALTPKKGLGLTLPSPDVTDSDRAIFDTMLIGFAAPDKVFVGITFDNVERSVSELTNVVESTAKLTGITIGIPTLTDVRKGS